MHGSGIAIWFFIGVLLVIYGGMICGYGIYEWLTANYPAGVQLTDLHTPFWWGGLLLLAGILYVVKFRPGRASN
jgi:heme/copper-type cytochrome/quinol oxidase subunit 3